MLAWTACRPVPIMPSAMRLLGATWPSAPNTRAGTTNGAEAAAAITVVLC